MFAFSSMGGKIDYEIIKKPGPYIFRICGQNHHMIGSLLPIEGETPKFSQLYIYDTENEFNNRVSFFDSTSSNNINTLIVDGLMKMFDEFNVIAKSFRMVRDRFKESNFIPVKLKLIGKRTQDTLQYTNISSSEVAGLIVGDFGAYDKNRDIIVEYKTGHLKRISVLHPSLMAMQYPILFPYGEDGYRIDIDYTSVGRSNSLMRKFVTMREYYAYRIQQRLNEPSVILRGGRLFQQYIVDAFSCVEEERLDFIRRNKKEFRSEIYISIKNVVHKGISNSNDIGKSVIILPSSYTGSPQYMIEHYHDAMTICRFYGHPDLFITFTCNPLWPKIQRMLDYISGQKPDDRPDIISRVFRVKLLQLIDDIKKMNILEKQQLLYTQLNFKKEDCLMCIV